MLYLLPNTIFSSQTTKKNWKMLILGGLLIALTGHINANTIGSECIDLPSVTNCQEKGITIYPSFPGASGPTHFPGGQNTSLTPSIASILQSLINDEKATDILQQNAYTIEISGLGKKPDSLFMQGNFFKKTGFWIRSFEGNNAADNIYLINLYSNPTALRAYRSGKNDQLEDITQTVFPPLSTIVLPAKTLKQYQRAYFSGVFLDDSRLNQVPVLRWIAEIDPNNKKLFTKDTRVLSDGITIHFGFLVWNGKSFDLKQKVERALWPCRKDRFNQQLYCDHLDPFVIE